MKRKHKNGLGLECPSKAQVTEAYQEYLRQDQESFNIISEATIHISHHTHSKHAYGIQRLGQMSSQYRRRKCFLYASFPKDCTYAEVRGEISWSIFPFCWLFVEYSLFLYGLHVSVNYSTNLSFQMNH